MKQRKTFGEQLKEIRLQKGLSQEELATLLGTTKQVISRYETNQRTPKVTVVHDYAQKLNLPIGQLLGSEDSDWKDVTWRVCKGKVDLKGEIESLMSRMDTAKQVLYGEVSVDETVCSMTKNTLKSLLENIELLLPQAPEK